MGAVNKLVDFWRKCPLNRSPFIHPEDRKALDSKNRNLMERYFDLSPPSFQKFIKGRRFGNAADNRFYSALLPAPYMGSLKHADIIILMLNPGFEYVDFYAEAKDGSPKSKTIRALRKKMILQKVTDLEFPFGWLDPQYCWHSGFVYWERKLRDVLRVIANKYFDGSYLRAMREMSKRVAALQLVPYHSAKFDAHYFKRLPSASEMRNYVHRLAKKKGKLIIVMRQQNIWRLRKGPRTIVYETRHALGASLGVNSKGGKAILKQFRSKPPRKSISP